MFRHVYVLATTSNELGNRKIADILTVVLKVASFLFFTASSIQFLEDVKVKKRCFGGYNNLFPIELLSETFSGIRPSMTVY